jgi:hypothetical protein
MSKLIANFERDVMFLAQNMVPMETSGLKIDKLDYEASSDDEGRLEDHHIETLASALCNNDTFQGPLNLSKNNLTDQVSYNYFLLTNNLVRTLFECSTWKRRRR